MCLWKVVLVRFASMRNVGCYIDVCLNWTSFKESDRPGFAGNQNKFCSVSFPKLKLSIGENNAVSFAEAEPIIFQLPVVSELLDLLFWEAFNE